MALQRFGRALFDPADVAYVDDFHEENEGREQRASQESVTVHFKDQRELVLYGDDAEAVRKWVQRQSEA